MASALDSTAGNPCGKLNTSSANLRKIWVSQKTFPDVAADIATGGVPKTFLTTINEIRGQSPTDLASSILAAGQQDARSAFRLLQFLSGGGVASALNDTAMGSSRMDYTQIQNILLKTGPNTYQSIVDSYIAPTVGTNLYTYSTASNKKLSDANIWTPSDEQDSAIISAPRSVLGKLLKAGYLLQKNQLYDANQFNATGGVASGAPTNQESLVLLYAISQGSGTNLTAAQIARRNMLEATNLRFFGAFLAEYCYYRTRYDLLLSRYYEVYTSTATPFSVPSAELTALIGGAGSTDNLVANTSSPTKADYLRVLAYHMACLNTRLVDMRRVLGAVNTYYATVLTQIEGVVNAQSGFGSNGELQSTIVALNNSGKEANEYLSDTEYRKGVMQYNEQKNKYSTILLSLYAVLNIAAIAAIFQVSRST